MISVQLNSFVHRIEDKERFAGLVLSMQCGLKRIRRSRNWLLSGTEAQLIQLNDELKYETDNWVKQAIEKSLPKREISLDEWLSSNPNTTVNQLVKETGCTVVQARQAIDKFEQLD